MPSFPRLDGDLRTEVAIVGAGIAGLTAGLLLRRAGRRVVILDAGRVGGGETGRTTAHLTEVLDTRYHVLEDKFGREGARDAAVSSRAAIDRIAALVDGLGIRCGFVRVPGYLYAETDAQRSELEQEFEALQRVGAAVAWADTFPLPLAIRGAIRIERQAQLHPLAYLRGLVEAFIAAGGTIHERTPLLEVEDGAPCVIETGEGTLSADEVLVMTHAPVSSRIALHPKIAAYRSYVIAAPLTRPFPPALFWDMNDPYHYVRAEQTADGPFLIVGGEDHKTGQEADPDACFQRLEDWMRGAFPQLRARYRWSGQILEPVDGLPFIGRSPGAKHLQVATGFSGNGMTFGTLAGLLLADGVQGISNGWAALYEATRFKPLAQAREFVTENVDFPSHLAGDRLDRGDARGLREVGRGEGHLVRVDGRMVAAYRDERGELHARSAVCTHLGCHVHWNGAEKSWDCPCHGSRFGVDGEVLNGPAAQALPDAEVELPAEEQDPVVSPR